MTLEQENANAEKAELFDFVCDVATDDELAEFFSGQPRVYEEFKTRAEAAGVIREAMASAKAAGIWPLEGR